MLAKLTERLLNTLVRAGITQSVSCHTYVGMTFLYITPASGADETDIRHLIKQTADALTQGRNIFFECYYFRKKDSELVYRFRFRYPDEKSFCCGNRCLDCTYKRPK